MKRSTRSNLIRFLLMMITGSLILGTACSIDHGPAATDVPTEIPTIEPEVPTAPPLSEEEAYDVAFALPVTTQNIDNVDPQSYAALDGLGRTLSFNGDSYSSTLHSSAVGDRRDGRYVGIFYSDWHDELSASNSIRNITQILAEFSDEEKEALKHDFKNKVWKGVT